MNLSSKTSTLPILGKLRYNLKSTESISITDFALVSTALSVEELDMQYKDRLSAMLKPHNLPRIGTSYLGSAEKQLNY